MKELRFAEIRADALASSDAHILVGTPIVYEEPTLIHDPVGEYTEIIKRGALDNADLSDVRLLYNHDTNKVPLARTPRTMRLLLDPVGLQMRAQLPVTSEADAVYEAVKRRDLTGMSFAFVVPDGGDTYDPKTNTRTILKIQKVYECSVVPFPAYAQASVEARSAFTAAKSDYETKQRNKILINQILKVR